jgi:hypothetical protein
MQPRFAGGVRSACTPAAAAAAVCVCATAIISPKCVWIMLAILSKSTATLISFVYERQDRGLASWLAAGFSSSPRIKAPDSMAWLPARPRFAYLGSLKEGKTMTCLCGAACCHAISCMLCLSSCTSTAQQQTVQLTSSACRWCKCLVFVRPTPPLLPTAAAAPPGATEPVSLGFPQRMHMSINQPGWGGQMASHAYCCCSDAAPCASSLPLLVPVRKRFATCCSSCSSSR